MDICMSKTERSGSKEGKTLANRWRERCLGEEEKGTHQNGH